MKKTNDRLSVFLANPHVGPGGFGQGAYMPRHTRHCFERTVDEILKMDPLPGHVVVFGDLALWTGRKEDYEASKPAVDRLKSAGIEVAITMGNHDRREPFIDVYYGGVNKSPVPDRIVSVVDLGTCDLILLDTLWEHRRKDYPNPKDGMLDEPQQNWLAETVKATKRPFIVGSHHRPRYLRVGKSKLWGFLGDNPHFSGYVHAETHCWDVLYWMKNWSGRRIAYELTLPSAGAWGDIGYAVCRTQESGAVVSLAQRDFYYPCPPCEGEKRPMEWARLQKRNQRQSCTFFYSETAK